ncbi:hypothetical protein [Streptomyces rhizoryzae]|uniref:hypothetical protein n=1 Tax=Streptomyces rhizoryzae TaxID=2932493 RepID=UPI0035582952
MAAHRQPALQDQVALAEIDLTGELMIAAAASEDRLSTDRIDELLHVTGAPCGDRREGRGDGAGGEPADPS